MNTPSPSRIAVFGAGAIGSLLAARLARAGHAVSLVARPAHVQAIRAGGLRLREGDTLSVHAVTAATEVAELGPQDLVLVTLKAHALPAAARDLRTLADSAPIVFVVNGLPWWYLHTLDAAPQKRLKRLDPQGELWRHLDLDQVLGAVIHAPTHLEEAGLVRSNSPANRLFIGEPGGGITPRLQSLAAVLAPACSEVTACADLRIEIWRKLLVNLPSSLLSTLTLARPGDYLQHDAAAGLYVDIVEEGLAVARAYGISLDLDIPAQRARGAIRNGHVPSMLQDLLQGKHLETDAQIHAVRDLARQAGVPVPRVDTLAALLDLRLSLA